MITTVIFDAEGVVFDTESIWDRAQVEFLRRRGVTYQREQLKPLLTGRSLLEGVRIMQRLYGFPGEAETLAQERLLIVKEFLAVGVHLIDGFLSFFTQIRETHKCCIATAMERELFNLVETTFNLKALFNESIFFISDVEGKGKPQPDIFLYAARTLQVPVEECVVIEDAPLGIQAAKTAGMKCIAITTTYQREHLQEADVVVDSFAEMWESGRTILGG